MYINSNMVRPVLCWLYILLETLSFVTAMSGYRSLRNEAIQEEKRLALGGDVKLSTAEKLLDEKLITLKRKELCEVNGQPWTKNFVSVIGEIEKSEVFKFIKKIPKGGSLHSHLYASVSFDYVVSDLLHRDKLYVCNVNGKTKLKFLSGRDTEPECELLSTKRNESSFDDWLKTHLLLSNSDIDVWQRFRNIFTFTYDLFSYIYVFEDYVYRVLLEHYSDNVMYMEVRSPFVPLYDLEGTTYQPLDFVDALWRTVEKFKKKYPDFIGLKLIYAQYRGSDAETVRENLNTIKTIIKKYPTFVAGIDFVGYEEERILLDYLDVLCDIENEVNFYFHAGETNRQGSPVDLNILDAILLGSKRIGHAYALPKHPRLMQMVKQKNIAIEVCPISNQVLGLVTDLRNHPATYLIAHGYPVVICNDDPGNWGAEGLSYDWYFAFMAMSSEDSGLQFLKKLAMNSLQYSALSDEEKRTALKNWNGKWNEFVDTLNNETWLEKNNTYRP